MEPIDKKLGMHRSITRRDFVYGASLIGAGALIPGCSSEHETVTPTASTNYPPGKTGMRGNHDGAFEVAHALARESRSDWGTAIDLPNDECDLVVVGAGISGLAAAHFYRKHYPTARILILDNHDDFGGHAKRNEFNVDGKQLVTYGGSIYLVTPDAYSDVVKELLDDLKVDLDGLAATFDQEFHDRFGLAAGIHFQKEHWGVDKFVPFAPMDVFWGNGEGALTIEESIAQFPMSEDARQELLRLYKNTDDRLAHIAAEDKVAYLSGISYRDYLEKHLQITEPEVFRFFQGQLPDTGMGIEANDAYFVITETVLPGWANAGIEEHEGPSLTGLGLAAHESLADTHHFPDGNATIARLLVRKMVPGVAAGSTMSDIVTEQFDYDKLDHKSSKVRVRLNSTAVHVEHDGSPETAEVVRVSYVRDGQTYRVRSRHCILACYNSIIPYLCPTLPSEQRAALKNQVKQPILYTQVALSNWRAVAKTGLNWAYSPGAYFQDTQLDWPTNIGDFHFSSSPDEPIVIAMFRFPLANNSGMTAQEQFRVGRHELLVTPFEAIERQVRVQLTSMFGDAGFNAAEDIRGITVNRWAHGYAYSAWTHKLFDTDYEDINDERYPHVIGRKQFGRIAIANSDAGAWAMLDAAVEQGHRAVSELAGA